MIMVPPVHSQEPGFPEWCFMPCFACKTFLSCSCYAQWILFSWLAPVCSIHTGCPLLGIHILLCLCFITIVERCYWFLCFFPGGDYCLVLLVPYGPPGGICICLRYLDDWNPSHLVCNASPFLGTDPALCVLSHWMVPDVAFCATLAPVKYLMNLFQPHVFVVFFLCMGFQWITDPGVSHFSCLDF